MLRQESPKYFKENVRNTCQDQKLRAIVKKATTHSLLKRQEVVEEVDNWEDLRQQGYEIRKEVVNNLERYLIEFQKSAEKNAIKIFQHNSMRQHAA